MSVIPTKRGLNAVLRFAARIHFPLPQFRHRSCACREHLVKTLAKYLLEDRDADTSSNHLNRRRSSYYSPLHSTPTMVTPASFIALSAGATIRCERWMEFSSMNCFVASVDRSRSWKSVPSFTGSFSFTDSISFNFSPRARRRYSAFRLPFTSSWCWL